MLETVDLNAAMDKETYTALQTQLDARLGQLQRELKEAGVPVAVILEGWDAAGKGSTLNRLLKALDPRGFNVYYIAPPTKAESMFPPLRRFWIMTPEKGTINIFSDSWYRLVLDEPETPADEARNYDRIRVFERQLADSGTVVVKFFLHISKKEQAKRFKKMSKDPAFAWKVTKDAKRRHKHYDEHCLAVEDMLRETSTPYAPWTVVPSTDERFRNVTVAETLVAACERALARPVETPEPTPDTRPRRSSPLSRANLQLALGEDEYNDRLPKLQEELRRLQHLCYVQRKPVVMLFEGWDAAGKGGAIRRLTRELDPRGYNVIPIAAPDGAERNHHYLWRFWRALPKAGHFAIFDRTWYGRVLVERVEGFATPQAWTRAYREINEFESELAAYGTAVFKFWLHVSKEEQLERFESRQTDPNKNWKITEEDWRNREKWDAYYDAVSDMIEWTSTVHAPWTIVEGNDKLYARIKILQTVADGLRSIAD